MLRKIFEDFENWKILIRQQRMLYKATFSTIFWYLYLNNFAQASHYVTKPLNSIHLLEKDSQSIDVQSPTECILKCRNQFQKNGFYTKDNSCFCTNGTTSHTTGEVESQCCSVGYLYSKRDSESKFRLVMRFIRTSSS